VKKDITPDLGNITLLGAKRIVVASYGLNNPIPDEVVGERFLESLFHNFFIPLTQRNILNYTPKKGKKRRDFRIINS